MTSQEEGRAKPGLCSSSRENHSISLPLSLCARTTLHCSLPLDCPWTAFAGAITLSAGLHSKWEQRQSKTESEGTRMEGMNLQWKQYWDTTWTTDWTHWHRWDFCFIYFSICCTEVHWWPLLYDYLLYMITSSTIVDMIVYLLFFHTVSSQLKSSKRRVSCRDVQLFIRKEFSNVCYVLWKHFDHIFHAYVSCCLLGRRAQSVASTEKLEG